MDEDIKALAREALQLYKRHVDVLEKNQRFISSGWRFSVRIWTPLIIAAVVAFVVIHFLRAQ